MFYGEEDSSFQNLPPEMIVEVLSLVDLKGKQGARLVCRRWRWILDHPDLELVCFKLTNRKMTENSIQCLLKSQLYIDHLELKNVKVTWPVMTYSRNKFPPIRQLTLGSGNSDQSLTTALQYGCAQTESLTLDFRCLNPVQLDVLSRVLSGMRWNLLTDLTLKIMPHGNELRISQENNDKGLELILKKARIPNLRAVCLDLLLIADDISIGVTKLMSNFMIFLEHHSKTLKELRLTFSHYSFPEDTSIFPNIFAPLFSAEQRQSVARDLKIECLSVSTTHIDALILLVPPCVLESENLTKLTWRPLWGQSWSRANYTPGTAPMPRLMAPPGTLKPMQALIQRNCNTLTSVTTTFIHGDLDVDPFEISWLESCPHLSELTITNCDKLVNVRLQLPTVRKLKIGLIIDYTSIEDMSAWITRTFLNLETVQFPIPFTDVLQVWRFDWIQNLLPLPRLGEIGFQCTHWYGVSRYPFSVPDLIRQYCSDKGRLIFREQRRSVSCLIKILPTQN